MSNNRLRLEGLDELRRALQNLPEDLTDDATAIVFGAAEKAKADMYSAYPSRTGELRKGLSIQRTRSRASVSATVRNRAPHAWIVENGTQVRHTVAGFNRGRMPPLRVFIPAASRNRREMIGSLKSMVTQHGLLVTDTGPN